MIVGRITKGMLIVRSNDKIDLYKIEKLRTFGITIIIVITIIR